MADAKKVIADGLMTFSTLVIAFLVNIFLVGQFDTKTMTYSTIIGAIWGAMDGGSVKKLQVNMANIRRKLGCTPGENRYIINELGVGYRMLDGNG